MKTTAINNLMELKAMLSELSNEMYTRTCPELSGASIGQHMRHILEFYICLRDGYTSGIVNYDKRKRDLSLESSTECASQMIDQLIEFVGDLNLNQEVSLQGNWNPHGDYTITVSSNYKRELAYNIEHSIHHQALIRVGLILFGLNEMVSTSFGVAPATIRYRSN